MKEKDNNKKIYITTGGTMGDKEFDKLFKEIIQKCNWDNTSLDPWQHYSKHIFGIEDEYTTKKENLPKITNLEDLFEKLDNEEIDSLRFWYSDSELRLVIDKKENNFKIKIIDMDNDRIMMIIKSYLNKTGRYLTGSCKTNFYAINLLRAESKEFKENCFKGYEDSSTIKIRYNADWFVIGKTKLNQIFELFPDVKVYWLKIVKKEIEKGKAIIESAENHPVYQISDEDRLMIELMED